VIWLFASRGQRLWSVFAPVQPDKTLDAVQEIRSELVAITSTNPVSTDELRRIREAQVLSLPARWETSRSVVDQIAGLVDLGRSPDFYDTYATKLHEVTPERVLQTAQQLIRSDQLVWILMGDWGKIENDVRAMELGALQILDAAAIQQF
jgi:zinc protease